MLQNDHAGNVELKPLFSGFNKNWTLSLMKEEFIAGALVKLHHGKLSMRRFKIT